MMTCDSAQKARVCCKAEPEAVRQEDKRRRQHDSRGYTTTSWQTRDVVACQQGDVTTSWQTRDQWEGNRTDIPVLSRNAEGDLTRFR